MSPPTLYLPRQQQPCRDVEAVGHLAHCCGHQRGLRIPTSIENIKLQPFPGELGGLS
jgi:hypothetical protein